VEHSDLIAATEDIQPLSRLIERLRGENGCPWDRKQTPKSIAVYLVEEMYELIDAIHSESESDICEEMGDVLFQVLFLVSLYQEKQAFSLSDVVRHCLSKMIRRHPHVFGDDHVESSEDVRKRWQEIKRQEKPAASRESILDSIPRGLPALIRAYRVSERAARSGFDWKTLTGVMKKVEEEWVEFIQEIRLLPSGQDFAAPEALHKIGVEFGDILFTLVNVARFSRIHPETALADATNKFEKRFRHMEQAVLVQGTTLDSLSHAQWNELWEIAKAEIG
jgi:tetrapyrrole methylase family protein/MazG family protein